MTFDQSEFDVRCEWGEPGVSQLAPISDVVIIVDVLSFSTCVDIATSRKARVFPYRWKDESARAFAAALGATLADSRRNSPGFTLSPHSLLNLPAGARLVLPSPNGSSLTLATGTTPTLTGCLRNYQAVASVAQHVGKRIAVIPAGERWIGDATLRPAFEDWLGAGAIISQLAGSLSPEARAAGAAFRDARAEIVGLLRQCSSGKELIERGFEQDVALAGELNVSECVPIFTDGAYVQYDSRRPGSA